MTFFAVSIAFGSTISPLRTVRYVKYGSTGGGPAEILLAKKR